VVWGGEWVGERVGVGLRDGCGWCNDERGDKLKVKGRVFSPRVGDGCLERWLLG